MNRFIEELYYGNIDPQAQSSEQNKKVNRFFGYLELPTLNRIGNYKEETRKGAAPEYIPNALPA